MDTLLLTFIITGSLNHGLSLSAIELITKLVLYFFHERLWIKVNFPSSNKRHVYKTITWRIIGTLDTLVLATIIIGNPYVGLKIGAVEFFTKIFLYFGHEKMWYKINFGLERRMRNKQLKTNK